MEMYEGKEHINNDQYDIHILQQNCDRYLAKAKEFKQQVRDLKTKLKNTEILLKEEKSKNFQLNKENQTEKRIDTLESTMKIQYQELEIQRIKSELLETKKENKELLGYIKKSVNNS